MGSPEPLPARAGSPGGGSPPGNGLNYSVTSSYTAYSAYRELAKLISLNAFDVQEVRKAPSEDAFDLIRH